MFDDVVVLTKSQGKVIALELPLSAEIHILIARSCSVGYVDTIPGILPRVLPYEELF